MYRQISLIVTSSYCWSPPVFGALMPQDSTPVMTAQFPHCLGPFHHLDVGVAGRSDGNTTDPPPHVTVPNLVVSNGTTYERAHGEPPGKWTSRLSRTLKITGTNRDRSATYDFLSVIYGPISYRFRHHHHHHHHHLFAHQ